jgi:hypothetical protein
VAIVSDPWRSLPRVLPRICRRRRHTARVYAAALAQKADVKTQAKAKVEETKQRVAGKKDEAVGKAKEATPDSAGQFAGQAATTARKKPAPAGRRGRVRRRFPHRPAVAEGLTAAVRRGRLTGVPGWVTIRPGGGTLVHRRDDVAAREHRRRGHEHGRRRVAVRRPAGEVGQIVAGSPPVRMGRTVERLAAVDGLREHTKRDAPRFLALGDNGEGLDAAARWLNRLIPDLAAQVRVPMRIELLVSLSDRTYRANQRFAAELKGNEWIDCRLTLADYDGHRHVKDDFGAYACSVLSSVAGLEPASN